jgi:hypothetical protein
MFTLVMAMSRYEIKDHINRFTRIKLQTSVSKKPLIVCPPSTSKLSPAMAVPLIPFMRIK